MCVYIYTHTYIHIYGGFIGIDFFCISNITFCPIHSITLIHELNLDPDPSASALLPPHRKIFSSIPGLYSLNARSTYPPPNFLPVVTAKKCPLQGNMPLLEDQSDLGIYFIFLFLLPVFLMVCSKPLWFLDNLDDFFTTLFSVLSSCSFFYSCLFSAYIQTFQYPKSLLLILGFADSYRWSLISLCVQQMRCSVSLELCMWEIFVGGMKGAFSMDDLIELLLDP